MVKDADYDSKNYVYASQGTRNIKKKIIIIHKLMICLHKFYI